MNQSTRHISFAAPANVAFDYISDIRNLPEWAINYCRGLREQDGGHRVKTPTGEVWMRVDADKETGVIDLLSGPDREQMAATPTRVIPTPDGGSMFLFTLLQPADLPDEVFAGMCAGLDEEFAVMQRAIESLAANKGA